MRALHLGRSRILAVAFAADASLAGCRGLGSDVDAIGFQPAPQAQAPELRTIQPLTEGWWFTFDTELSDDEALAADAAGWEPVSLPHTWNAEDAASLDADEYARGIGWYRLELATPADGARHWLEFGAASLVADVWLNGEKLGEHRGGFTQFRFDVTDRLAPGGTNVLLVKVDNREPDSTGDPTFIDPLGGDYNRSGGLYRHVALVSTPAPVHFTLGDLGGPGVYARTTALDGTNATVEVRAIVRNETDAAGEWTVRLSLVDADGQVGATAEQAVSLPARDDTEVVQQLSVANARLWQGIADPHLYRLVADLLDASGAELDRVAQTFGIRVMRFDPDEGFFLNGRHVRLNGVAMHQDFLGEGWAISDEDLDTSLALVREMGANAVRLGHYPFSHTALEKVSALGLVAWAEKASGLRTTLERCSSEDPDEDYLDNARQQLRELIRQQYNHAAIAVWSVGNETEAGQLFCGDDPYDNVTPYLRELHRVAKEEDPSRPTGLAEFSYGDDDFPHSTSSITDVLGTNRYFGWYETRFEEFSPLLDEIHAGNPDQPLGVTEYGGGAALTHHTDDPLGGPPETRGADEGEVSFQPEEYAAYLHSRQYGVISSKPWLWGSFAWNMFDFGTARRNEGDVLGVNTKGLVSFDRRTRKDPFFFYKANWSPEPVTYVVGRRYTDRAYSVYDVMVFSNADAVELAVNGTPVATLAASQCPLRTCSFEDVALQRGANRVTATGSHAGTAVSDTVEWTWDRMDVNIAAGRLATGYVASTGQRFGSDHFFTGGTGSFTDLEASDAEGGPLEGLGGTDDPLLFSYFRSGDFSYEIPLADGTWEVTLGFVEPDRGMEAGERVFGVTANGEPLLENFDVVTEAGSPWTAATRTFTVQVSGGRLVLDFTPTEGEAIVSNIAIRSATAP